MFAIELHANRNGYVIYSAQDVTILATFYIQNGEISRTNFPFLSLPFPTEHSPIPVREQGRTGVRTDRIARALVMPARVGEPGVAFPFRRRLA